MSGITYIRRITGSTNSLVQLDTSDNTATALGANYITAQAANIAAVNDGAWSWSTNDLIVLSASDGVSVCTINSTFTTLTAISGVGAGDVTFTGPVVSGNLPKFNGTAGNINDSGIAATQVMTKNSINQMAAGDGVLMDKGTGTVVTNAVTVNHQAGVITTGALTTASGANATAITLTNSFITTSSVILCQLMGGTNTTLGVTFNAVPGSGSASITITNGNVVGAALNGTVIFGFVVL